MNLVSKLMRFQSRGATKAGSPILGVNAIPHLSLYHLYPIPEMLNHEQALLDQCAAKSRCLSLKGSFSSIRLFGNWLFWMTPRTPELDRLHRAVVEVFAPFRWGKIEVSWPMDSDQQEMHFRYGYPAVMRCFNPHITLAVFREEAAADSGFAEKVQGEGHRDFRVRALAIGEIGPKYGELIKIEYEIPFVD